MGNLLRDRRTGPEWSSDAQVIEIAEKIGSFEGLAEIIEFDLAALEPDKMPTGWRESTVDGQLHFGFLDAEARLPTMTGKAAASVDAVCQRCLQPFRLALEIEPQLVLLGSDERVEGYEEFEVWELKERAFRPIDIVDELLIMAMPFSTMHNSSTECGALSTNGDGAEKMLRPFAELRSQMDRK